MNTSVVLSSRNKVAAPLLPQQSGALDSSCEVGELRCENLENPLGLDVALPRFSWKINSTCEGVAQSAWQMQVVLDPQDWEKKESYWDSGRVKGSDSVFVEYAGPALSPHTRYFWRVRIWDEAQQVTAWSPAAFWETGFLGKTKWPADWITLAVGAPGAPERPCRYVRKAFELTSRPASARLYITACGLFEPWLNGRRVGRDWLVPGWTDYSTRMEYLTYDVTDQLSPGVNVLGAILGDGWYCGYLSMRLSRNHYGAEPALLAALRIVDADGGIRWIGSGTNWSGLTGPIRSADLYMGEVYDACQDNEGWCTSGFPESGLQAVCQIEKSADVAITGKIVPPIREVEQVAARSVAQPRRGVYVFDLGQNIVGVVRLKIRGARGARVTLRHAEMLNADGTIYTENLRAAQATDTYICKGKGEEIYTPQFTFHGFRYVELTGIDDPSLDAVTGVVLQSDLPSTGSFSCSHELINKLQSNIRWGQRGNFLDIPMDCPQRDERLGWTGDAQIFSRTASFNYDVSAFFRKWLLDVRDAQYEDGSYPDVAPDLLRVSNTQLKRIPPHPHSGNAAYAEAGVICPWVMYERYGDKGILEENYAAMCRWIDYQVETSRNFICTPTSYGDWLATDAVKPAWAPTPCELVGTAYFAYAAELMSRTAQILGRHADVSRFAAIRKNVVDAFNKEFVTPSGRVVGDTQTGYLLALGFDLLPPERREAAGHYLVQTLARRNYHLSTGFVGTPLLCPVLSSIGRTDLAYRLLFNETYPSWLFPVKNGATTVWERWNSWTPEDGFGEVNMNSFNHYAYGAIGEWLYAHVGGIQTDIDFPGFKRIILRPEPGPGLTWAQTKLESPYGLIESSWEISGDMWKWRIQIPPNTHAVAQCPPGADMNTALINGQPIGRQKIRPEKDVLKFKLSSGKYYFESGYISPF